MKKVFYNIIKMNNDLELSINKCNYFYETSVIICMIANLAIIILDIGFVFGKVEMNNEYSSFKSIFSFFSNIIISFFGMLISMKSIDIQVSKHEDELKEIIARNHAIDVFESKTIVGKILFIVKNIIKNYEKNELLTKAYEIIRKLNDIKTTDDTLENSITEFKSLIKKNLLYRVSVNNYLNLITWIFFYFNVVMFFVPFYNETEIYGSSKKIVEIFMGVFNQIFSLVFSYIAIVCDNVNFLHRICDNLSSELKSRNLNKKLIDLKIKTFFGLISNPLTVIFNRDSDFEKSQDDIAMSTSVSIFGSPK